MITTLEPTITKPRKIIVPLAVAQTWGNDPAYRIEPKLDGRFETRFVRGVDAKLGETLLAGENVGGEFHAFDLLMLHGEEFRDYPLRERLEWLSQVLASRAVCMNGDPVYRVPAILNYSPSTLQDIWNRGGEGVVRKRLDAPWGVPMEACKRLQTFTCIITGMNTGQSVRISRLEGGSSQPISELQSSNFVPCGSVALKGGKCDRVRVGSILKIEGFGLTAAGQIREPRPCRDSDSSFLIQY